MTRYDEGACRIQKGWQDNERNGDVTNLQRDGQVVKVCKECKYLEVKQQRRRKQNRNNRTKRMR